MSPGAPGPLDLIILGAGPAGVGLAHRAARDGRSVCIIERGPTPGGLAASIDVAGVRVDLGSHRLHGTVEPRILAVLRELLGADLQEHQRRGRIRLAGRWLRFPLRASDLARNLPPVMAAGMAGDLASTPVRRRRAGTADSFSDAVETAVGPTLARRFYLPYAQKIWGLAPGELSAEQARRRVSADRPLALAARVVAGGGARAHLSPRRGYGQLWDALLDDAERAGAEVLVGTTVVGLTTGGALPEVRLSDGRTRSGRLVASTIPLTALAGIVAPTPAPHVRAAAASLRSRAMVLVYLELEGRPYTPFDAHYLPEGWTPVTRISEPMNYRVSADDPAHRTVLCAEIPCDAGDDLWRADDAALAGVVTHALGGAGMPSPRLRGIEVRRLGSAYPILARGFEDALGTVAGWADDLPGVVTLGRQGLFTHDNAHHALAMAWAAADAIGPGGGFDTALWERARADFARHVVED